MQTNIAYYVLLSLYINFCVCKKYNNYTLFRGIPVEEVHMQFFNNLTSNYDVNFWRPPGMMYKPVDFIISPSAKQQFLREADNLGLYLTTLIDDVQRAFDMQTVKTYIRRKMDSFDWDNYFRLNDIYQWLQDLAKAYPVDMELQSIGKTYENRNIMAVKIVLRGSKMRSRVFVEGGIHAREWIAPAFVTYFIYQILTAPMSTDEALKDIAMTYEWYFVPVVNPDGYEFSHVEDRLWRKNRHGGGGLGVDLNRNFDHAFGTVGISKTRNSDIYCGPHPFSERESLALSNFIKSKSDNLEYYLAFHSYGQYMIIPYANSKTHIHNYDEVHNMCMEAKQKIYAKYKTKYVVGTASDTVGYVTSGVSGCWTKWNFGVPYVVTFELRDSGYDGFALPTVKILPTCQETMDGVISLLRPRTPSYKKLRESAFSAGPEFILEKIVFVFNVLLFIIVRFD